MTDYMGFPVLTVNDLEVPKPQESNHARVNRIERNWRRCFPSIFRRIGETMKLDRAADDTDQNLLEEVRQFISYFPEYRKNGSGLLFYGENGRGKTFLGAAICNELLKGGYRCLFTSTRYIRDKGLHNGMNATLDWLCGFDLVVLDDLFRDRDTSTGAEAVFNIVDALYAMEVPMVVTTNLSRDALRSPSKADKAVIERLKERCRCLEVQGRNRRRR